MTEFLASIISAIHAGQAVANPTAWKKGTIAANTVAALIVALVGVWDSLVAQFHLPAIPAPLVQFGADKTAGIVIGVVSLVNVFIHIITTKEIGVKNAATPAAPTH